MRKDVIRVCLLSLVLIIISTIILVVFGRTYTATLIVGNNGADDVVLVNKTGKVEIINKRKEDNKLYVTVNALEAGDVHLEVQHEDYYSLKVLYVHKTLVISDSSFFGKSTCSEVIPISISIILIYILYLLIKRYRGSVKENIFQYKNVAYLGIIIFLFFSLIRNILSIFNYNGVDNTVNSVISSASTFSFILLPIAIVTFILVTISNIRLLIKEGKSLRNLLGVFLGIFLCVTVFIPDIVYGVLMKTQIVDIYNLNGPGPYIYNFLETLVYLSVTYLECVLLGTIIVAIMSVRRKLEYNKDYIIILGCQIRKDGTLPPLLRGRVDKALEFRNKQLEMTGKDLVFIPSGGKGSDEVISEAEAMKKYLVEKGIKEKNIIIENKSKNTYENIKNSYKLIKKKKANIAFSTTNYHVFRAGLIATNQGLVLDGMGSRTKAYFWINAFIREFIGTLYTEKRKHILVILLIMLILIMMITITYFSNNI